VYIVLIYYVYVCEGLKNWLKGEVQMAFSAFCRATFSRLIGFAVQKKNIRYGD